MLMYGTEGGHSQLNAERGRHLSSCGICWPSSGTTTRLLADIGTVEGLSDTENLEEDE